MRVFYKNDKNRVLTLASLGKDGVIQEELIEDFESIAKLEKKLLTKEKDVLIRLSYPYTATYITKDYENLLFPSLMVVIRVKSKAFLPEYIKIFLNSDKAKEQIRKEANGTVIPIINTKALGEIEVPHISLQKQNNLIHITQIHFEEKKLTEQILELKEKEYQYFLNKNINEEEEKS